MDIKKIATLAKLPLTKDEESEYSKQLVKVLDYMEQLSAVSIDKIDPLFNVVEGTENVQERKESNSLTQDQALINASQSKSGLFVTKGVFQDE